MSFSPRQQGPFRALVKSAWDAHCKASAIPVRPWRKTDAEADTWYRDQLRECLGTETTAACDRGRDYDTVMAHFEALIGESYEWQWRRFRGDKTRIVHAIQSECLAYDVDEDYMRGIARQALQTDDLPELHNMPEDMLRILLFALVKHLRRCRREARPIPASSPQSQVDEPF